jgi:hypothetical protein
LKNRIERRLIMARAFISIILALFLCLNAGTIFSEEMAKEGSGSGKTYWTGTYKVLAMGKEMAQMNYEGYGVNVSDTKDGLTHLSSTHVIGGMLIVKGNYENDSGIFTYTLPDGDQIFATYNCSGSVVKGGKGNATIVGGTGKLVGITGTVEFTRHPLRPPAEDSFASFSIGSISWKLP